MGAVKPLFLEIYGGDLLCTGPHGTRRTPLGDDGIQALKSWAGRYDVAVLIRQPQRLPAVGREMADWLNAGDSWLDRGLAAGTGPVMLEIRAPQSPDATEQALLDAPWEVLAPGGALLAEDAQRLFQVVRRLGKPRPASPTDSPPHGDIAVLFMAAEVEGQSTLNYEREEMAFLDATAGLDVHWAVEESGSRAGLDRRLRQRQEIRPDVLHLTAHGEIGETGPYLLLETEDGGPDPVDADALCTTLGDAGQMPRLVFLSACRTAETEGAAAPYTQALIRAGVANALGWDGSVYDTDATRFAAVVYGKLAGGSSVAHAVAAARHDLLKQMRAAERAAAAAGKPAADTGTHWHLARLWVGPDGGGPLCDTQQPARALPRRADKAYLDPRKRRVPVAAPEQFVGRRRPIQAAFREWNAGATGILVQGMGNLGKSSLAERIASRHNGSEVAVVYGRYDAHAVFLAVLDALPEDEQEAVRQTHEDTILHTPAALKLVLQKLLKGPLSGTRGTRPVLLIIDDLEQCLETPKPGQTATPFASQDAQAAVAAVIAAFRDAGRATRSRLLVTSRYSFALTDDRGRDLAAELVAIPFPAMDAAQRAKQMHTAARLAGRLRGPGDDPVRDGLEARIRDVAGGNPGLQEILTRPLLTLKPADGLAAATRAVAAVEHYRATGTVPADDSAAQTFFRRVSLEAYRAMLTPGETALLRAATLFTLPVPGPVLETAGRAGGVGAPGAALDRLLGLGLLDRTAVRGTATEAQVNPLARPLVPALSDDERAHLAAAVVLALFEAWADEDGDMPVGERAVLLATLALCAGGPPAVVQRAGLFGGRFLFDTAHEPKQALDLAERAIACLDAAEIPPDLHLLRLAAECAGRLGHGGQQDRLLKRATATKGTDPCAAAMALYDNAVRLFEKGDTETAEGLLRDAVKRFEDLGDVRERAVTMGKIADILTTRGQTDEALRIFREDLIPAFERLGDVRSRAVTMGKIADILTTRGQTDEALRIFREDLIPAFERLGDVRERAVTMGKIADILTTRGQTDEALRIFREDLIPAFERLGDVRSRAVTMGKIADILTTRGQTDEALRIRRDEELPVYERLGDVRERAVTMGKIADILTTRGQTDEALRIRYQEQLPVYERLGDVRSRAVTMGKIADILTTRGQTDEALRIHVEERLPVAEAMGDSDSLAHVRFSCATIRLNRGGLETGEADTIAAEVAESFSLFRTIGRTDGIAIVGQLFGQILAAGGLKDEALAVLDQAAEAFTILKRTASVEKIRALQASIRESMA
ncbi:phosphopentomutase [Azospirillum fermentarium]|uniref:CHAT domain-containing protein n=1 Tax=Azospirillum fermentarium TaxID=1233114 RepID=UPI0022280436|nr:CHAT domain-containing protein [Azospirillum fermentarium]MCW2246580.1 phosphopentomutase [Azospirillum fermentarium]